MQTWLATITKCVGLVALLGLWLVVPQAFSQEVPEPDTAHASTPEAVLREVQSKKLRVRRDVQNIPDRVNHHVRRIETTLDAFWRSGRVRELFAEHHKYAEQTVEDVFLPDTLGNLQLVWEQLRGGAGANEELKKIIERYIRDLDDAIVVDRDGLIDSIFDDFANLLESEYEAAREEIRAPFVDVIAREFPVWDVARPVPPVLPPPVDKVDPDDPVVPPGTLAGAGILLLIVHRIVRRITRRIVLRIVGKVLSKLVPVVGWVLLALDVWNAAQAKTKMEEEMRGVFVEEYREQFLPETFWRDSFDGDESLRTQTLLPLKLDLNLWARQCREEADRALNAAEVLHLSPQVQEFISTEAERGSSTEQILEEFNIAWDLFGSELVAHHPIQELLNLAAHAPDHDIVRQLRRRLGSQLVTDYQEHGADYLLAADRLGISLFMELLEARYNLNWTEAYEALLQYPPGLPMEAKRGLLALVECALSEPPLAPSALQTVHREHALVRILCQGLNDRSVILDLIQDHQRARVVSDMFEHDSQLARICVQSWDANVWNRYARDHRRFDTMLAVWDYRRDEKSQSPDRFASEISDGEELTLIWADVGIEGLRLWDAYVQPGSGDHQKNQARTAIHFYKKGYQADALKEPDKLGLAELCSWIPFAGPTTFHTFHGFGRLAYAVILLLLILFMITILIGMLQLTKVAISRVLPGRLLKSSPSK